MSNADSNELSLLAPGTALLPRLLPQQQKGRPVQDGRSDFELDFEVSPLGLEPRTG